MKHRKIKRNKKPKKIAKSASIISWVKIRKDILARDSHTCRICFKEYDLHVHHIDYDRKNNSGLNLVTLCGPCHRAVHFENYKPYEHIDHPAPWGDIIE